MRDMDILEIVEQARRGDAPAFGELYDRYVDRVHSFVLSRVGGDRALAEDLTSEAFLRALRSIGSFTWCGRDIAAWLLTIARNLVYDHFKARRSMLEAFPSLAGDPASGGIGDAEDEALGNLTNEELHRAIRRLTLEQREAIYWRFLQGYSLAETAAVMGKNAAAIKALQYRAVCALHTLIAGPRPAMVAATA